MAALAVLAHWWLPPASQLPMQWGLSGQVNWSAPRWVALAFFPVFGGFVLGVVALLPADQGAVPATLISAGSFILSNLLYLWLLHRHLRG